VKRRRGPAKKPSALEALQGYPGKGRRNDQEPQPPALSDLSPPPDLSEAARAIWAVDAPIAHAMGTLTVADVRELALACREQAWGDHFAAVADAEMFTVKGKPRRRPSPAIWVASKLWSTASTRRARLGFNPSDRTRIKVSTSDADRDPLEAAREKLRQARAHLRPA